MFVETDETEFDADDLEFLYGATSGKSSASAAPVVSSKLSLPSKPSARVETTVVKARDGVGEISDISDIDASDGEMDTSSVLKKKSRKREREERKSKTQSKRRRVDVDVKERVDGNEWVHKHQGFEVHETVRLVQDDETVENDDDVVGPESKTSKSATDGDEELGECEEDVLLRPGQESEYCFGCEYGTPGEEESSVRFDAASTGLSIQNIGQTETKTAYHSVFATIANNRAELPHKLLVPLVKKCYNQHARPLLVDHQTFVYGIPAPCPEWTDRSISNHILGVGGHRKNNRSRRQSKLEMFDNAFASLRRKGVFRKDGGINDDKLKIAIGLSKHQEQIMREQERGSKVGS